MDLAASSPLWVRCCLLVFWADAASDGSFNVSRPRPTGCNYVSEEKRGGEAWVKGVSFTGSETLGFCFGLGFGL